MFIIVNDNRNNSHSNILMSVERIIRLIITYRFAVISIRILNQEY